MSCPSLSKRNNSCLYSQYYINLSQQSNSRHLMSCRLFIFISPCPLLLNSKPMNCSCLWLTWIPDQIQHEIYVSIAGRGEKTHEFVHFNSDQCLQLTMYSFILQFTFLTVSSSPEFIRNLSKKLKWNYFILKKKKKREKP